NNVSITIKMIEGESMTIELGELRARLIADANQMKQKSQAAKKGFVDLGEEGKKATKAFSDLASIMPKIGANADHLKVLEQQLKKINPANMEQGFAAIVEELQKMGAEKKQIEALEKALTEMTQQAQSADARVGKLEEELKELAQRAKDVE